MASANPSKGYANIVPATGGGVEGCLYLLPETALEKLDRCEGVPRHYERRRVVVRRADIGQNVEAFTYVARAKHVREGLKPTREYLGHLLARANCLTEGHVWRLRAVETLD